MNCHRATERLIAHLQVALVEADRTRNHLVAAFVSQALALVGGARPPDQETQMAKDDTRLLWARRLCAARAARRDEFPQDMFGDWPWSMLMLTYIAEEEGDAPTPATLYADANVSAKVGERWAAYLEQEGLVTLGEHVRLTPVARERLERYVDRVVDLADGSMDR